MPFVAKHLQVSRYTVYKYLGELAEETWRRPRIERKEEQYELEAQIEAYFAQREEELIEAISRLVRIPSIRGGEAEPGMPFGAGPAKALEEALALCGSGDFPRRI